MHAGRARHLANGRGVGQDRCGDAIDPLLDGPLAQRDAEPRGTQSVPGTPAGPNHACHLADAARQPWTLPTALL
jgi:hypothetical protein